MKHSSHPPSHPPSHPHMHSAHLLSEELPPYEMEKFQAEPQKPARFESKSTIPTNVLDARPTPPVVVLTKNDKGMHMGPMQRGR